MHDTCATANATSTRLREFIIEERQRLYTPEEAENLGPVLDGKCKNHIRNLMYVEWLRRVKEIFHREIGEQADGYRCLAWAIAASQNLYVLLRQPSTRLSASSSASRPYSGQF